MKRDAAEDFARAEPFFSVLTAPKYLRANITPQAKEEFFAGGEAHVAAAMDFIRSRVDPHFVPQSILEYGCGPGRLAIPFAKRARRVVAVDRSPAMLQSAARFAAEIGVKNIEFRTTAELAASADRFDLVNCHLVLQRLPRAEGLALLRSLLERVANVGAFHLPFRDRTPALSRVTRSIRSRSGVANAIANALLRKPAGTPLIPVTTYDMNDVLAVFADAGFESLQIAPTEHDSLDTVTFFVRRRAVADTHSVAPEESADTVSAGMIDVRKLMASTTIEEWNRRAEVYFSGLTTWEHHLIKPFSTLDDAPGLLMNFAIALQGLRLLPGLSVLDFGAGTGWLSRMLTQLGCRVFVLDVSTTALKMAEATYREIPIIGDRPRPEFVQFDGRTIPLGDLSVDRVLCFDAFHHSPNPDQMLREFGRILKPGGIAGFIEPGPTHSQRPQSQFEMRTYGVLENDIDIAEIWRVAQTAGFDDLRLAVSNLTPFHVSLGEFHDLLEGYRGSTYLRWADKTRDYMRDVRNFFLFKRGMEAIDSRRAEQLRAAIAVEVLSQQPLSWRATITNSGGATWLPSTEAIGGVWLGAHLYDGEGHLIEFELGQWPVSSKVVLPDETVEITFTSRELVPGTYRIEFDCVAAHVAWFGQTGSRTTTVPLVILSREDGEGSPAGSG